MTGPVCRRIRDFCWWFKIPLTFGDVIEIRPRGVDDGGLENDAAGVDRAGKRMVAAVVSYNGKITSIQLLVAVIAISVSMNLCRLLRRTAGTVNISTLTVFMAVGLVVMGRFLGRRRSLLATGEGSPGRGRSRQRTTKRNRLLLVAIILLYILNCVLDVFHVIEATGLYGPAAAQSDHRSRPASYSVFNGIHIVFHVVRVVYLGAQVLFCIVFNGSVFSDSSLTRCGLMYLAATNFSLAFDFFIDATVRTLVEASTKPRDNCSLNATNVSTVAAACASTPTQVQDIIDNYIEPIFIPFTIEIAVLIGECVHHLVCHMASYKAAGQEVPSEEDGALSGGQGSNPGSIIPENGSNRPREFQETSEARPLLNNEVQRSPSAVHMVLGWQAWFLVMLISNVFVLMISIQDKFHPTKIGFYFTFPFTICMILSIVFGYHSSRNFIVVLNQPFTTVEYLVVYASLGGTVLSFSKSMAYVDGRWALDVVLLSLIQKLLYVVQSNLQATFILYANRVVAHDADVTTRPIVFRYTIFYLAVSNGTHWLIQTFTALNLSHTRFYSGSSEIAELLNGKAEVEYFGSTSWKVLYNIMTPLMLTFRLVSCLMLANIFLRLRRLNARQRVSRLGPSIPSR